MQISDFLIQIVTVTISVTHATKLKWGPYFNQNRIEQLIDTPEKAVSVVLENGRYWFEEILPRRRLIVRRMTKQCFQVNSVSKMVLIHRQLLGERLPIHWISQARITTYYLLSWYIRNVTVNIRDTLTTWSLDRMGCFGPSRKWPKFTIRCQRCLLCCWYDRRISHCNKN